MAADQIQIGVYVDCLKFEGYVEDIRTRKGGKREYFIDGRWYAGIMVVCPSPADIAGFMRKGGDSIPTISRTIELSRDAEWWLGLPGVLAIIEAGSRRARWLTRPDLNDLAFVFDQFTNAVESNYQRRGIAISWNRNAPHSFEMPIDLQRKLSRLVTMQCSRLSDFRRSNNDPEEED